ncbi:hypothetical protein [Leptospira sp. GIMC2001]|uniref:hypothetical protein n=1 Tax=Leptospira sp. GIMC2001 TaxID=1513297 RepID=UPI0023491743|nr:hypothetical protein [Leptospira sp. GIMC2001]WCL51174.1 hypothetical protein O4O04_10290 [Leptospira sp. GIMC2001]
MTNIFKISIYFLILFLFFNCSDEEVAQKESGLISLEGKWMISPSEDDSAILDFSAAAGEAVYSTQNNQISYILLSDGKGVRIQSLDESVPRGYFLFVDRKKDSWTGIWDEKLVRLILQQ